MISHFQSFRSDETARMTGEPFFNIITHGSLIHLIAECQVGSSNNESDFVL